MGEIDTKPIESVQSALSLFGERCDHKKCQTSSSDGESDTDQIQVLQKELASYRVQLEAKETAHKQALLKLQQYEEHLDELSTKLMKYEIERDGCIEKCRDAGSQADELESRVKEMADQVSETAKVQEQLLNVLNELKATRAEILDRETELVAVKDSERKALKWAETMETSVAMERQKVEELLKHAEELGEAVLVLKAAAMEAEEENSFILSDKDAEIKRASEAAVQAWEQLEDMKKQVELTEELQYQLQAKSVFIKSLQSDLQEANELISSSEKAASDAVASVEALEADLEVKEKNVSERTVYIEMIEMELSRLKVELHSANENISHLSSDVKVLTRDLEEAKAELAEVKESEINAQVEIASLMSQLHMARLRTAAAEAAELRANSIQSGLYLAVQQLTAEAAEAKEENRRLRLGADKVEDEAEDEAEVEAEADFSFPLDPQIQTSLDEYESLVRRAELEDQMSIMEDSNQCLQSETKQEVEALKKELEAAMAKIGEFRTRAEMAMSRAESAEKAKLALEDQLKHWREKKQRRKAALAALREESTPRNYSPPATYDKTVLALPPLGKVLNLKF